MYIESTYFSKEVTRNRVEHFAIDTNVLADIQIFPMPRFAEVVLRYLSTFY